MEQTGTAALEFNETSSVVYKSSNFIKATDVVTGYGVFPRDRSANIDTLADLVTTTGKELDESTLVKERKNIDFEPNTINGLYFQEFISTELRIGIKLLDVARHLIVQSLEKLREGKRKESDELVMQFKSFLPELFCCRTISESFGAVINAIQNAVYNMNGALLSENQLVALRDLVMALLREPAMRFETAVSHVSKFEDADFDVESPALEGLLRLAKMIDEDLDYKDDQE